MNSHKTDRGNFESNILFLQKSGVLKPGQKIMEIGSGMGHMVSYLEKQGLDAIGTEFNEDYIRKAKEEFGVDIQKMEGAKLAFADHSFDVVLSFDVFEHIPNTDAHLQEVGRILKPGGYYLLATPNKLTNIPFEVIKHRSLTKYKEYHCSLHTYWGIKSRFLRNGFNPKFVEVPLVNDFFKGKVRRFLGLPGLALVKIFNPDKLPQFLKTNFYLVAKKTS